MSTIARLGSVAVRSSLYGQQRLMATATTQTVDPIQRIFLDKVKEFKTSGKGLDEEHSKLLDGEMSRLKRVYQVDDESKLRQLNYKFPDEHNVSLRDLDDSKDVRKKIASGEILKEITQIQPKEKSELLATIPDQTPDEFSLPSLNKPDIEMILIDKKYAPPVPRIAEDVEDWKQPLDKMTPYKLQRDLRVMFGPNMPTVDDDKAPERDVKNFPRIPQPDDTPPTRHHIIPESWFQTLYPKIGLSGPYTLAAGLYAFLFSKEWIVLEHEIGAGFSSVVVIAAHIYFLGPKLRQYMNNAVDTADTQWSEWQHGHIQFLEDAKERYRHELQKDSLIDDLYQARTEDIEIQLEQEHRSRLKQVFGEAKRKLNYLVSVADAERSIIQKNMVNWIISNSIKAIGPKQESDVLDSCVSNLKKLSVKHANVI